MLALARKRCEGLPQVELERADVGKLPIENQMLDVACALQVYCYVANLHEALSELHRVLEPGGRAVILDSDFGDLPRILPPRLRRAGFDVSCCEAVPFVTLAYHPNTCVDVWRTSFIVRHQERRLFWTRWTPGSRNSTRWNANVLFSSR